MVTVFLLAAPSLAGETDIVNVFGQRCIHGLHPQPNSGPFSVFVFCDDALGTNIGVILTERGAGPGRIELDNLKVWDKWNTVNQSTVSGKSLRGRLMLSTSHGPARIATYT